MNATTNEDLAQILCHRDELETLRHLIAADLEHARIELADALRQAQDLERQAEADLAEAESSQSYDDDDDDDGYGGGGQDAGLADAQERLEDCRRYLDEIAEEVSRTRLHINDLERDLEHGIRAAVDRLDFKLEQLGRYKAIDAYGGIAGGAAFSARTAKSAASSAVAIPLPDLPPGYTWVTLTAMNWQEVPADLAFKKASHQQIRTMLEVFDQKLVPLMRANPKLSRDDLYRLDQAAGRLAPHKQAGSLSFAWDCMFGSDPVALSGGGNAASYGWASGRHRAAVARSLGWSHLPVRIV